MSGRYLSKVGTWLVNSMGYVALLPLRCHRGPEKGIPDQGQAWKDRP